MTFRLHQLVPAALAALCFILAPLLTPEANAQLVFEGAEGKPGTGKHIVLIAGDEEYRTEESCPMLGKILAKHHGFKATVLFPINPDGGYVDPNHQNNIPGMDAIASADLVMIGTRFRDLPDEQLKPFADYLNAGKPVLGFRTATHGFRGGAKTGDINWAAWGVDILGEGWAGHYGRHKGQGARGIIHPPNAKHPVLNGVGTFFGESDVYGVKRVTTDNATVLAHGIVTDTLYADSPATKDKVPQVAVWIRDYKTPNGKPGKALCSTFGSSCDLEDQNLRRLFINAAYHFSGLDVPAKANVTYVDPFEASAFNFNRDTKEKSYYKSLNYKPADYGWGKSPQTGPPMTSLLKNGPQKRPAADPAKPADGANAAPAKKAAGLRAVAPDNMPTSAAQQQKDGKRPKFSQPTPVESTTATTLPIKPNKGDNIVFIGNSLAERMGHFGHFEARLHAAFAGQDITFRNMGYPAHTPAFRPEAGQPNPWAFPGGEKFRPEIKKHHGKGHYPMPDEWLTIVRADTIVAFFGFNESFDGLDGVENYKNELRAFIDHTLSRSYHLERGTAPKLVLASPTPVAEHKEFHLPDAAKRNNILAAYTSAMREVAEEKNVGFVDLHASEKAYDTINGAHLSDDGYAALSKVLFAKLFGADADKGTGNDLLRKAITDKNWFWRNDYRMLNGVHAYGQRWNPYGNFNYPEEIEKIRQMTVLRDDNIRAIAQGKSSTLKVDDASTRPLTPVTTNYKPSDKNGELNYIEEEAEALSKFILPEGYKVSTFATEREFPNLGNPAQMQFDNKGRLWVSTVPSYPHYKPGGPMPDDKLLIYEDTDGDGRADKETIFARNLHVPIGFQLTPEGVYISEEPYLTIHKDLDGDDVADSKDFLLDGFDPHDTHHGISSFDIDNGGGIFMCEGRFLHSQVETPWGPQRMADGGAWRFDPKSWKVNRFFQSDVSNPWAITHDDYGQNYLNDASGGSQYWMLPLSVKVDHGAEIPKVEKFNYEHHIRPSSGSEFLFSSHFPDEVQGDYMYCNSIGFLGIKQYQVFEDGVAIRAKHRQDLIRSTDGNCRPADLELAPDGSLYFIDWHNTLIGHMQHSARDPNRNSKYGRIYRITYPSRPLVKPPQIAGASIETLFENTKLHELQSRKRSHRELRGRDADAVVAAAHTFAKANAEHEEAERLALEALWATWGHQKPSIDLIKQCMGASDHRVRAGAVRVVRHCMHLLDEPAAYLMAAAKDDHPRVRLEALAAGSWLGGEDGAAVALIVASGQTDKWIRNSLNAAMPLLKDDAQKLVDSGKFADVKDLDKVMTSKLAGPPKRKSVLTKGVNMRDRGFKTSYQLGEALYHKDGACITCHQESGLGLQAGGINIYPPLVDTPWATGDKERAIKIVLHGMMGKMTVKGKEYDPAKGTPPMTAFGGMYSDNEVASVLNFVRNSWGNKSTDNITPADVKKVRAATKDRKIFWNPAELLKEHPLEVKADGKQGAASDKPAAKDDPAGKNANAGKAASGPLVYQGDKGFGLGKHLVFIASDHEYRSEETLPMLARILAKHHGFRSTVLFGINEDGHIAAGESNVPHMRSLDAADGMIIFTRFLNLPDEQMVPFENYLNRAGPVVGLRTASHGFKIPKESKWFKYDFRSTVKGYEKGFGHQVLGNTWVGHYGQNHKQGNEILLEPKAKNHPVLRGVQDRAFTYAGGYNGEARPDFTVLTHTQPLVALKPGAAHDKTKPKVPSSWTRQYTGKDGKKGRVFHTTQGASEDILDENYRRLVINGILWSLGMDKQITPDLNVALVGPYHPNPFTGAGHAKNVTPNMMAGWDSPIPPQGEKHATGKDVKR